MNLTNIKDGLAIGGLIFATGGALPIVSKTLSNWFGGLGEIIALILGGIVLFGLLGFMIYELFYKGLCGK